MLEFELSVHDEYEKVCEISSQCLLSCPDYQVSL